MSYDQYISPRSAAIAAGQNRYFSGLLCPRGHVSERYTANGTCCKCAAENQLARYQAGARPSPELRARVNLKWNSSSKGQEAKRRWKKRDPIWAWVVSAVGGARTRARKRGLSFNITNGYIRSILPTHCPALGCELIYGAPGGTPNWNSASIDRIVGEKGYVVGNVVIISQRANAIKVDASLAELEAVARWLRGLKIP